MAEKPKVKDSGGDEREKIRTDLNRQLKEKKLRPFSRVGSPKKGEFQPNGTVLVGSHYSHPYFVVPTIGVTKPNGEFGSYSYLDYEEYDSKFGGGVVVVINKKFVVLVKQHRLMADGILSNDWPHEVTRGWIRSEHEEDAALHLCYREVPGLRELTVMNHAVTSRRLINNSELVPRKILEDSSIRRTYCLFYVVLFESSIKAQAELQQFLEDRQVRDDIPDFGKIIKPLVLTFDKVNEMQEFGGLDDLHSLQAWSFAKLYLSRTFQMNI